MLDRIDTAYKAQRQFVDDAGHELRTPITVIRGHLELLDTATHDQRERSVKLCMDELDRMTRMVNDLLTLAIADADGPSFLHMQPIDLTELTIDIEDKADMVSGGRAKVTEIAEGFVLADAQRITEAILELTRNAVKYTNDDSPIIIGSTNKDGQVGFSVRDFGPGIDSATQEILFHRPSTKERRWTGSFHCQSDRRSTRRARLGRLDTRPRLDVWYHFPCNYSPNPIRNH